MAAGTQTTNRPGPPLVWSMAGRALAANAFVFGLIVATQAALQAVQIAGMAGTWDWVYTLVRGWLQIPLIYLATWTILNGGRAPWPWPRFWGFLWRLLLLGGPAAVVMTGALVEGYWRLVPVGLSTLAFAFLGTVLPDTVAGGSGGFGDALRRGRRTLWPFFKGMLLGPVLGMLMAIPVLTLIGGGIAMAALRLGVPPHGPETLAPWYGAVLSLLGSLTSMLMATLIAGVLAACWHAGGGEPMPAEP